MKFTPSVFSLALTTWLSRSNFQTFHRCLRKGRLLKVYRLSGLLAASLVTDPGLAGLFYRRIYQSLSLRVRPKVVLDFRVDGVNSTFDCCIECINALPLLREEAVGIPPKPLLYFRKNEDFWSCWRLWPVGLKWLKWLEYESLFDLFEWNDGTNSGPPKWCFDFQAFIFTILSLSCWALNRSWLIMYPKDSRQKWSVEVKIWYPGWCYARSWVVSWNLLQRCWTESLVLFFEGSADVVGRRVWSSPVVVSGSCPLNVSAVSAPDSQKSNSFSKKKTWLERGARTAM